MTLNYKSKKRLSRHRSQVLHQVRAYPGLSRPPPPPLSLSLSLSLNGMLVHRRVTSIFKFGGPIHLSGEKHRESVLLENTPQCHRPGLEPSFRVLVSPTRGHFFLAVFFRVTYDGPSERGTTRSLPTARKSLVLTL